MPASNTSRRIPRKKSNIRLFNFPENTRAAVRRAARLALGHRAGEVNIILLDDKKIRALNKKFRRVDRRTDVISFRYGTRPLEGDIFLSKGVSRRQASEQGHRWEEELSYLAIHGILHLFGHTDYTPGNKKKMFKAQDAIFSKC
jgi:probable rRNA maturation factor